jgi:NADPH:quinone reductase-like Zn-dependent oxidoreductase
MDVPEPGEGEVLVAIKLRPVNPTDIAQSQGLYGDGRDGKPFSVGSEGVGVVEKSGPGASKFQPGQRVVAAGWAAGTWQDYVVQPEKSLLAVPEELDDKTASQFYINPITVLGLTETSAVPPGGWLLQTAAGSVLGRQLVQYAKHIGIRTISVVRRDEHIEELKALGADEVINSEREDLAKRVKEITGGKGADAAVDPVGGALTGQVLSTVKKGGKLRLYGTLSGSEATVKIRDIMAGKHLEAFLIYSWLPGLGEEESRKRQEKALQLLKDRVMTPLSGKVFPFDQFKEAIGESTRAGRGAKVFLGSE